MSKPKEVEYNVTVLSRDEVTTWPKLGQAAVTVQVTYVSAGLAPKTVFIDKTMWSIEREKEVIRKDIIARLGKHAETYKV